MSIYDNETKIYPGLNLTAPQEPQACQLKKLTEIEVFFLDKIEACRREGKKKKRLNTVTRIVNTGLITSASIAGGTSILAFASSIGLPVGAALGRFGVVLSLLTVVRQKAFREFTVKQKKHDSIKLLAQSQLDSITDIISQAVQDGDISPTEFHKVLQERKNIVKLKPI